MKWLLTLAGPTGVGKTALSLRLAQRYHTEIISADSRQFYRGMDIGTAKPTPAERGAVPHHFIDCLDPDQAYSAGQFEQEAEALMTRLFEQHQVLIVVGGSTLYLQALWEGLDAMPPVPPAVRAGLQAEWQAQGLEPLLAELAQRDPQTYATIDRHNPARILRALELIRVTGQPLAALRPSRPPKARPWRTLRIGLTDERPRLYARIDARVEAMIAAGLEAEVTGLLDRYGAEAPGLQSIGYREWIGYFQGDYDRAEVARLIQRNSRRYAKRQLTYYRHQADLTWFQAGEPDAVCEWLDGQGVG